MPKEKEPPPKLSGVAPPALPPHRSEAIASLTAKARTLQAEWETNVFRADAIQHRQNAIRNELAAINKQVLEHAWDGQPPT